MRLRPIAQPFHLRLQLANPCCQLGNCLAELGNLIRHAFAWPGAHDPGVITYFDRSNRDELPRIVGELAREIAGGGKSTMLRAISGLDTPTQGKVVLDADRPTVDYATVMNGAVRTSVGLPLGSGAAAAGSEWRMRRAASSGSWVVMPAGSRPSCQSS